MRSSRGCPRRSRCASALGLGDSLVVAVERRGLCVGAWRAAPAAWRTSRSGVPGEILARGAIGDPRRGRDGEGGGRTGAASAVGAARRPRSARREPVRARGARPARRSADRGDQRRRRRSAERRGGGAAGGGGRGKRSRSLLLGLRGRSAGTPARSDRARLLRPARRDGRPGRRASPPHWPTPRPQATVELSTPPSSPSRSTNDGAVQITAAASAANPRRIDADAAVLGMSGSASAALARRRAPPRSRHPPGIDHASVALVTLRLRRRRDRPPARRRPASWCPSPPSTR